MSGGSRLWPAGCGCGQRPWASVRFVPWLVSPSAYRIGTPAAGASWEAECGDRGRGQWRRSHRTGGGAADGGLAVWALEPYFGGSHKAFLEGLAASFAATTSRLFTLPGRYWKWRMHGAALSPGARWRAEQRAATGEPAPTSSSPRTCSTCPCSWPRWLLPLGRVPTILYFHENQLTYPLPPGVERDLSYGFKNLASAAGGRRGGLQQRVPPAGVPAGGDGPAGGDARRDPRVGARGDRGAVDGAPCGLRPAPLRRAPGPGSGRP